MGQCPGSSSRDTISSVQVSCVQLFATPWTAPCQASLSITSSWSLLKLMFIESVMTSNHLILCHPLLRRSIFPSIRVFSNESVLYICVSFAVLHIGYCYHLSNFIYMHSVQFSLVAQSCPTLCNPMDCSSPGLPVHHQLPKFTQTHVR